MDGFVYSFEFGGWHLVLGHKVHPIALRLGIISDWKSRWFSADLKKYNQFLKEDVAIRGYLNKEFARVAGIEKIEIERSISLVNIIIHTARPGILIGRGGQGTELIKNKINSIILKLRKGVKGAKMPEVRIEVREVRNPESYASLVAYRIIDGIERRIPFRRLLKEAVEKAIENKEVQGVKIAIGGRLDGTEIARTEWLSRGRIPLNTLRAKIDYFEMPAKTSYGTVGVKVWLYKGEVFDEK